MKKKQPESGTSESKTPPSTSAASGRSTSGGSPKGTLVSLTGDETDEELEALAEQIYRQTTGGSSSPPSGQ
jgi:hypothetical protein